MFSFNTWETHKKTTHKDENLWPLSPFLGYLNFILYCCREWGRGCWKKPYSFCFWGYKEIQWHWTYWIRPLLCIWNLGVQPKSGGSHFGPQAVSQCFAGHSRVDLLGRWQLHIHRERLLSMRISAESRRFLLILRSSRLAGWQRKRWKAYLTKDMLTDENTALSLVFYSLTEALQCRKRELSFI